MVGVRDTILDLLGNLNHEPNWGLPTEKEPGMKIYQVEVRFMEDSAYDQIEIPAENREEAQAKAHEMASPATIRILDIHRVRASSLAAFGR